MFENYSENFKTYKEQFGLFASLLSEYNKKYNLTSICDIKEVYIKHFLDSILPKDCFSDKASVI